MAKSPNRYEALIEKIFFDSYSDGATEFEFKRADLKEAAASLKINLPDNLGDVIYAFRFRVTFLEPHDLQPSEPSSNNGQRDWADRDRRALCRAGQARLPLCDPRPGQGRQGSNRNRADKPGYTLRRREVSWDAVQGDRSAVHGRPDCSALRAHATGRRDQGRRGTALSTCSC